MSKVKRKLRLGKFPAVNLAQARKLAAEVAEAVEMGRDPVAEGRTKRAQRERNDLTLADLIGEYIEDQRRSHVTTVREIERALKRDIVPTLGHLRPADITDFQIEAVIDGVAKPATRWPGTYWSTCVEFTITRSGAPLSFDTDTASPTIPPIMSAGAAAANPGNTENRRSMIAISAMRRYRCFGRLLSLVKQIRAPYWP